MMQNQLCSFAQVILSCAEWIIMKVGVSSSSHSACISAPGKGFQIKMLRAENLESIADLHSSRT